MRLSLIVRSAPFAAASLRALAAAGIVLLTACSGSSMSQSPINPPPATTTAAGAHAFPAHSFAAKPAVNTHPGWISQQARLSRQLIYVADGVANQVLLYPVGNPSPSPIGALTYGVSEPEGMWVDGSGDLWVANTGNNTVEAFRHNQTKPYLIINQSHPGDDYGDTADVVLDRYGNAWVAGLTGIVTEYAHDTTTPVETITSGLNEAIGMTFDSKGYLYVTNINPFTNGQVFKFAPGWTTGYTAPYLFPAPRIGGILFDSHHNTYIADQSDNVIQIYAHGSNIPTSTISNGILHPCYIAFDKYYNLYVQDYYNNNVTVYAYGGSSPIATISTGLQSAYGVTVWSDKY
jgi:hypothetical protein